MTFHSFELGLRLHSSTKPYILLSSLDSWLPQQEEGAGVAHFVGEEEDALQGLLAPMDVVSQEEVVFASRR